MAKTTVPTIEDTSLADIDTVKLVFSSVVITAATWPAVKEALGDQLYTDGRNCVTMQETGSETESNEITEKTFEYNVAASGISDLSSINHILYFSGTGSNLSLQASHPLGSSELPMDNIKLFRLKVTMSDPGAASGKICSNFLDGTVSIVDVLLNYREHVYEGELFGIGGYKNQHSEKTVHANFYKNGKNGEQDALLCTTVKQMLLDQKNSANILASGSGTTPRTLYIKNIRPGKFPISRFGNDNRRYAYLMYFYYNRANIASAVNEALRKVKLLSDDEVYALPEEAHLGFNDWSGAYLYLYDLNVKSSGYMLTVLIGCNANMRIDIYISKLSGLAAEAAAESSYQIDLHEMPLRINHWYDRLYFVLPYYSNASVIEATESELDSKRHIYTVYPDRPEGSENQSRPAPELLGESEHEIDGKSYYAQIYAYYPYLDAEGNIIQESAEGNMDTKMERMFEDFEHIYMLDFSDMGDVLVNLDYDEKTKQFKQTFFNIFGDTTEKIEKDPSGVPGEKSANRIFNRYNLEGRCLNSETMSFAPDKSMTSSYDQCVLDALGGLYTTSAAQLKYLIENHYIVVYAGSAFTIGYSQYHKNFLVLFKCNRDKKTGQVLERVRRKIAVPFRICDEYILHKDQENEPGSCEFVDGSVFRTKFTVEEETLTAESAESALFCGIPVKDIIAAGRHVIVLAETDAENNITGAYRY